MVVGHLGLVSDLGEIIHRSLASCLNWAAKGERRLAHGGRAVNYSAKMSQQLQTPFRDVPHVLSPRKHGILASAGTCRGRP